MFIIHLFKRVAFTACALSAQLASAQSSIAVYGLLDLSLDVSHKTEGNVQGTAFGFSGTTPVPNSLASPARTLSRVSTSLTGQSHLGFKGIEDLGGGWMGKFQLESGLIADNGTLGNDGRIFGKSAWVGLTTPYGEIRAGRQAAPMLAGYYLSSVERLGTTDIFAAGVTLNNLQVYQDNMLSYTALAGGWLAQFSYSPNAGVAERVSAARSVATPSTPAATNTTGQIVGGASAGGESDSKRGRTYGALVGYMADEWTLMGAYHSNDFNVAVGLATPAGDFIPLFNVESYRSFMLGGKYRFPNSGTDVALSLHSGHFMDSSGTDPKTAQFGVAVKQSIGAMDLIGQFTQMRFTNYTKGKDIAVMLGADYNLSKRTTVYLRAGQLRDKRGDVVRSPITPIGLAGGPEVLLVPLGSLEIPLFSGAGASMGATTRLVGFGIRHSF